MPGVSERAMDLANKVLAKCAANDPNFPRPSEAVRLAWAEHIGMTSLSLEDLLDAVTAVYGVQTGPGFRMLPGHVIAAARVIRQDRVQRTDVSPPAVVVEEPDYPAEWTTEQRLAAYWERVDELRAGQQPTASPGARRAAMTAFANRHSTGAGGS